MALLQPEIILIVNGTFLILTVIAVAIILRSATFYRRSYGDQEAQTQLKRRILRLIFIVLLISLAAAVFNLFLGI